MQNRHIWLHNGIQNDWLRLESALAVDEFIEFCNGWSKEIPKNKMMDTWIRSTAHLVQMRRSLHFCQGHFGRDMGVVFRETGEFQTSNDPPIYLPYIGRETKIVSEKEDAEDEITQEELEAFAEPIDQLDDEK